MSEGTKPSAGLRAAADILEDLGSISEKCNFDGVPPDQVLFSARKLRDEADRIDRYA